MPAEPDGPLATIAGALRRERERVGISLAELARRAGVEESVLSQLESGTGNPSMETLWALSVALSVPLGRLVEPASDGVRVIRAGEGPQVRSEQADFTGTLLSAGAANLRRDIYLIKLEPGAIRTADAHTPRSVEHVVLTAGRLRVGPESGPVEIDPGDYAAFPGDAPHRYEALLPGTVAVLVMEHP